MLDTFGAMWGAMQTATKQQYELSDGTNKDNFDIFGFFRIVCLLQFSDVDSNYKIILLFSLRN